MILIKEGPIRYMVLNEGQNMISVANLKKMEQIFDDVSLDPEA